MDKQNCIALLVERIKTKNPTKIILFGSYAYGNPTIDSDIDILVVTCEDYTPKDYKEKMNITLQISNLISDIKSQFPVDLLVFTKPMYQHFLSLGSMFSKEITSKGITLYEGNN